jgi:CheY-like chemotaxis protein
LADRGQLEQVVMNLVVNARDAMPSGGSVTIQTSNVELESSAFHQQAIVAGRYVMLAITDSGTGMTKEVQHRLFEPFFTTKDTGRGTGLGLSTTYGIVKQSKGYIWVYSELGVGTTFKVYLPRSRSAATPRSVPALAIPAAKGVAETVLLVEDEPGVRKLSKRILDRAGYHVLEATDGDDAERVFASNADSIDLVVTDVMMPGCGGPELYGRLRIKAPDLRVLYMSGFSEPSAVESTGFDRGLPFVQKPFTAAEFTRQVRIALDR